MICDGLEGGAESGEGAFGECECDEEVGEGVGVGHCGMLFYGVDRLALLDG